MVFSFFKRQLQDFCIKDHLIFENMEFMPDDEVIEIGVGSGSTIATIASRVQRVTGADISLELIERLQLQQQENKNQQNINFICGDATNIEFAETLKEQFDKLISCDTLEHVSNPEGFFKVSYLLLKPSGSAIITFPNESQDRAHGIVQFSTIAEIKELLHKAGFQKYSINTIKLNRYAAILTKVCADVPLKVFRRWRKKIICKYPSSFPRNVVLLCFQ